MTQRDGRVPLSHRPPLTMLACESSMADGNLITRA